MAPGSSTGKVKNLFAGLRHRLKPGSSRDTTSLSRSSTPNHPETPTPTQESSKCSALKDAGKSAWKTTEAALRLLEKNADGFPPLKTAITVLLTCVDLTKNVIGNREEYEKLAVELGNIASALAPFAQKLAAGDAGGGIGLILKSINEELAEIQRQLERGKFKRAIEATGDQDDVLKRYRKIDSLFRRLLSDITLRTHVEIGKLREATDATLLRTLVPVDDARYNSGYSTAVKRHGCTPSTREQILDDLRLWVNDATSSKVFWLNGMAGTGKTTIMYTFCQWLEEHNRLAGNFFCSRTSTACRDLNNIVRSVAYQLAHYSPAFRSQLCTILEERQNPHMLNVGEQFKWVMETPLQSSKDAIPEGAVIVIDALDECDNASATTLFLDALLRFAGQLPIKFMVASRPEPVILEKMQAPAFSPSVLRLHEIERSLVEADIRRYLQEAFSRMSPVLSLDVIDQLTERSGKLFIYAATVARYVNPEGVKINSTKRLQAILGISSSSASLRYQELDKLYMAILSSAFDETIFELEELQIAALILRTVICAIEPMTIVTMSTILALEQEEVTNTLSRLQSVLHVQEGPSGLVSILHASFPDFLFDKARSLSFYCDLVQQSTKLAHFCFDVMNNQLHFNICNLETSFLVDKDVPNLQDKIKSNISNALFYTCRHWSNHLTRGDLTNDVHDKLINFLQSHLLFWMEVLNLMRCISLGSKLLLNTISWLKAYNYGFKETERKLYDADFFVKAFSIGACKKSTPHIYISALPFCHRSSFVYHNYWKKTRGLLDVNGSSMLQKANRPIGVWKTNSPVKTVAFSPDGATFASGSQDGSVCIWDANSGEIVAGPFMEHTHYVHCVTYSPDNSKVASGSYDNTICIWDVRTGTLLAGPLKEHDHFVFSVRFSPDSKRLVSGSGDGTIMVREASSGNVISGPFKSTDEVMSVAFTPDGSKILSVSADKMIHVWDALTGAVVAGPFEAVRKASMYSIAFAHCGTKVAIGYSDDTILIWDVNTGAVLGGPFVGHTGFVSALVFSRDDKKLFSGAHDRTIRIWGADTGDILSEPFEGHTGSINSLALSPDGTRIISGSFDKSMCAWNVPIGEAAAGSSFKKSIASGVSSVAFSPDGKKIGSGLNDGSVAVWNAQTGNAVVAPFKGHTSQVYSVTFSPDGSKLLTGSGDYTVALWDSRTGKMVGNQLCGHSSYVYTVAYSPDGSRIASGSGDHTIILWDPATGNTVGEPLKGHENDVQSVVFSPDAGKLVSGGSDRLIFVWNVNSSEIIFGPIKGHTGYVQSISFSPDGTKFASGSNDMTIRIWDMSTGDMIQGPFSNGHTSYIESVGFSPDGTMIVSGSLDHTICLWDAQTSGLLTKFEGHTDPVMSVAYAPDGGKVISGSGDRSIRIWDLEDVDKTEELLLNNVKSEIIAEDLKTSIFWPHKCTMTAFSKCATYHEDGWLTLDDLNLLWTSFEFRENLCFPHNYLVIGPHGTTIIDYSRADLCIGRRWINCWLK
ncbi:WD40 repeat-like protein [Agrocybe pediades]|nr:WD40 repeat-like protein [Agrocybe pediades]